MDIVARHDIFISPQEASMPSDISAAEARAAIDAEARAQIRRAGLETFNLICETCGPDDLDRVIDYVALVGVTQARKSVDGWRKIARSL